MVETYKERLLLAEALLRRARTRLERDAFREIATLWRRLADREAAGG